MILDGLYSFPLWLTTFNDIKLNVFTLIIDNP
jgi:hypothetical protein